MMPSLNDADGNAEVNFVRCPRGVPAMLGAAASTRSRLMHAGTVSLSASAGSKKATRVNTGRSGTVAHAIDVVAAKEDEDEDADDDDAVSADSLGCAVGASVDGTPALLDEK